MLYEQFVQETEKIIRQKVGDQYKVYIHVATKNNGLIRKGITISEKGINVSPTIYLEEFYDRFLECDDLGVITDQIIDLYYHVKVEESWQCDFVTSFEGVKDRIVLRLINRDSNRKLLEDVPYLPFMDLAIVFHVLIEMDTYGDHLATMLVRNEHMEIWDVAVQDLYLHGIKNSERLLPAQVSGMCMLLNHYLEDEESIGDEDELMYVLTNQKRAFGAAAILYKDQLKKIGMLLQDSFYILPSSVHEVIVVPARKSVDEERLKEIVFEINHTQVAEDEILSDNIYFYGYDSEKKESHKGDSLRL